MAHLVLINPRFEGSYWGLEHAMPLFGKQANMPVASLPLLAALTPAEHRVTLLDENVAPLDFEQIAQADVVGLTGMSVQRQRMREILVELKRRGCYTVVGGPWVSVQEDYFADLADVIFVGEAEESWPRFLADWAAGQPAPRYEQAERTDMTRVPCPNYAGLPMRQYMFGSLQISRGCPFQCEFCDIIVTFGRRPRLKTAGQVLAELEALRGLGQELVFIVDDNLIGNRRAIAPVLEEIARWQQANGFPLTFFTEASLDLADDDELLELLVAANIQAVFIGIESPNAQSLAETKKFQNLRPGGSLVDKVRRVQDAGMEVWTGMIMGFDHDDATIFDGQLEFLRSARVIHAMTGMLAAIPKTPLYERLRAEQRLDLDDAPEFGTNVVPLQMSREELRDGYVRVMQELAEPHAFFERVDSLYLDPEFCFNRAQRAYWRKHRGAWLSAQAKSLVRSGVLIWRLLRHVREPELRQTYRSRLAGLWRRRPDPAVLFVYVIKCAAHYHYWQVARGLARSDRQLLNSF